MFMDNLILDKWAIMTLTNNRGSNASEKTKNKGD